MNAYGSTDGAVSTETRRKRSLCAEPAVGSVHVMCFNECEMCRAAARGGGWGAEKKKK